MLPKPFVTLVVGAVVAGLTSRAASGARQNPPEPVAPAAAASQAATINRYCGSCHSAARHSGDVVLQGIDLTDTAQSAQTLEKAIRKLRSGTMPPPGSPRPDPASYAGLRSFLETTLDRAAAAHPNPGRTSAVHRLNRAEYANAIRDLLDMDIDAAALLPPDDSGYGFDNIADVLSVSPMLTERYLSAAQKISRIAVGDPAIRPATEVFSVNKYLRQEDRTSEDVPFGSRGGLATHYYFPVDADYVVKIFLDRTYDGRVRGLGDAHILEVRLNGEKVKELTIGQPADAPRGRGGAREVEGDGAEVTIHGQAGPGVLSLAFLKKASEPEGMLRPPYAVTSYEYAGDIGVPPGIRTLELRGPYDVKGPGASPSRTRIFVCRPSDASAAAESKCARQILSTLARRAYRRPVVDADVQPLLDFYTSSRPGGTFDGAIEASLRRLLVSPDFLFRFERDPANVAPGAVYRISDVELASRLSFFLWSSIPDDELLDLAQHGQLRRPAILDAQVKRMLADKRAGALVDNFASQWLYLRNLRLHTPDPMGFPDFDENLRLAFDREIMLFLDSQLRDDRPVPELLTADYTFVNERLARHYGIPNVYGNHFRRVTITDDARKGLLGKGAVLTVTSYPNRTSPVLRGKWLLENVLGAPPPPPPPNVPALKENVAGSQAQSVRERMEQHRADPVCASCHRVMDPLGFAMENFDAIGRWRDTSEGGARIDASGTLMDGTRVTGPDTLREALASHQDEFVSTVVEKLMTYALGRGVEYYDAPAVRGIVRQAAAQGYKWSDVIRGIVDSVPFQMRSRPTQGVTQ